MKLIDLIGQKGGEVISVTVTDDASTVANTLVERNVGSALVFGDNEDIVGIVSERDLVYGLCRHGASLSGVVVGELMTKDLVRCSPDDDVTDAMGIMTSRRIRHLPVFDGDVLVGIISIGDLVKHRIEEVESEARMLRDYIAM